MAPQVTYLPPFRAAVLALFLGSAFLIGGPERISGPSYSTVRQTGGEVLWGVVFLLLSLLLIVAARRSQRWLFHAYMAAATGYALFALAVVDAARQMETGGLTGIVVYSWVAWIHVLAAAAVSHGRLAHAVLAFTTRLARAIPRPRRSHATAGSPPS